MRPCPKCRAPLQNRDATCPHCGAAESAPPKPNSDPPPKRSRGNRVWDFFFLVDTFGPPAVVGLLAYGAFFGVIGYLLAGKFGAGVEVVVAIALLVRFVLRDEGA
jgi:hypothetical protein